jgi:hypothetical protein
MPIREQKALSWSWRTDCLESRLFVEGQLCITSRFKPATGCVYLSLLVENLGLVEWRETKAVVCLRLVAAPDFCDPQRKRTYWWCDNRWSKLERGFPKIEIARSGQPVLIATESEPPGFVVAMGWSDVWNVGGNDLPHNVCVHTDPRLGNVRAGEYKGIEGILIFEDGDKRQALEKFIRSPLF